MIAQMLRNAINEKWPFLTLKCKFSSEAAKELMMYGVDAGKVTDTIEMHWPLNIINEMPNKEANLWIATVCITDEMIRLSLIKSKEWCYENTLSDPNSLDALYTILSTHINDVYEIIPKSHQIPQAADEPTLLELDAKKMRKAHNLTAYTELRILKWD
tara:strand:- start:333 stop:806 length:474 start_codon:yes stop_codon:yes gene_type:complete